MESYDILKMIKDENDQLNEYFKYLASCHLIDYFKEKIIELDRSNDVYKMRIVDEVDPDVLAKEKLKYKDKEEKLREMVRNWRNEHPSYYRTQVSLPQSSDFFKVADDFEYEADMTLERAIQGYKAAKEFQKEVDNEKLSQFCTEIKTMLNNEFRAEYNQFVEQCRKELDLPTDAEIKESLDKVPTERFRLSLDRTKCADNSDFENAYEELSKIF